MMKPPRSNPFDLTKATEFSDKQISDLWVDLAGGGGLLELIKPRSRMSLQIVGGKGSGKTHLMRYCSFPVQKMRHGGNVWNGVVTEDGYLGVYLRANGLFPDRFANKGQSQEVWDQVFAYYLELWLGQVLVSTLSDFFRSSKDGLNTSIEELCAEVLNCFDSETQEQMPLDRIVSIFRDKQKQIDRAINNLTQTQSLRVDIAASPGRLVFGIPDAITKCVPALQHITIVYLIDELELLSDRQQRFVNSLIRHKSGPCTFRLGARLYGIKTNVCLDGEENKEGSEFERVFLDSTMRDHGESYADFARRLCALRLKDAGYLPTVPDDREELKALWEQFFDVPPESSFRQAESIALVNGRVGPARPHLKKRSDKLDRAIARGLAPGVLIEADKNYVLTQLQCDEYPLLEKLGTFLLYQDWADGANLCEASAAIADERQEFIRTKNGQLRFGRAYGHYALDMLAQMYRDSNEREKAMYVGFGTFIGMSHGVPRHLLMILKHVYKWSLFNGERPFQGMKISKSAQRDGAQDAAGWFFEDARPGREGPQIRDAIGRLGELFRDIRYSDKPVECSLMTFSVRSSDLSPRATKLVETLENWSFLIKIRRGQSDRNSQRVDDKYQMNCMLAPRWGLPVARRGAVPLRGPIANAIFDSEQAHQFQRLKNDWIAAMNAPTFGRRDTESLPLQF